MLMYSDKLFRVRIKDLVSSDLVLRNSADSFFDRMESEKSSSIEIDFSDVASISRSFAHQYIIRKGKSKKSINEVNVPETILKMLKVIEMQENKRSFLDTSKIKFVCL